MSVHETSCSGGVKPGSHEGLKGRELVSWALKLGPICLEEVGKVQIKYFEAVARDSDVSFPEGFFESSIDKLMPRPN